MTLPILIDCDEVLSDFVGAVLDLHHTHTGRAFPREDVTGWDLGKVLNWPACNVEINAAIGLGLCGELAPVPGAIEWLRDVESTFGAERVYVCTSPSRGPWASDRLAWLERHGVPKQRQIQCSAKHLIPGYLVDDSPEHCEARPKDRAFCLAAPWNRDVGCIRGDHAAALCWLRAVAR